jgi:hypothetical protein
VDELTVSTVVYVPPKEAFEFLVDFPGYAEYSAYLEEVRPDGEGGVDTTYELVLSWWKLTYTARSQVTAIEPPDRIDWELVGSPDASGSWLVEPEEPPEGRDHASRITLAARFDPDSLRSAGLDVPRLVSLDWVLGKVAPLAEREARRVVERVVADLEGERRPVELTVD